MKQIWRILRFTSTLKRYYVLISVWSVLLAAMTQLQPLFTKAAIDEITKLASHGDTRIWMVGLFAVLIFLTDLGQTFLSNIAGYQGDVMAAKLQKLMSTRYFEHMLKLPQRYFDVELSGKIINRMNRGISQISDFMQFFSNNMLQFIFSTILTLVIVAIYSWQVALMLLLLYPVFIFLTGRTSTKWQGYQTVINKESDIAGGRFAESIGQVRVVKSFVQEARELAYFSRHYKKIVAITKPQSRYWHRQDILRRVVLNVIFLAVYAFIFIETAKGTYTIGTMVLLIQYAALIRIPLFSISFFVDRTQRAVSNTKDYFLAMDELPEQETGGAALSITKGEISFRNVDFGYDHKKVVLSDISLTIKSDTKVALVGESGEGKTTLTNLILKLYKTSSGTITIDGQDIAPVSATSLRGQIGVVFQEPALFSGTIRENISYSNPDASNAAIVSAAKSANADGFISELKDGYDTEIGERGLKLSGGQKQRIAIARALLKDPPILILDEATSSLDSRSEALVQEALRHLMKNRTTLIIAHRLSTIAHVDEIITIKGGRIDEVGSPSELARTGGIYSQLLDLQQGQGDKAKEKLKQFEIAS